jgi:homoserine O-acetyltransferase
MALLVRRAILALLGICAVAAITPAAAQTDAVHIIQRFAFENGATLENMRVGYVTWGRLNEQRSNAILLLPGTSGARTWPTNYIGPGRAFDPERFFIISADPIGGGASSSPADGMGPDFPRYTLHDMVRAQHDLITRGLGIDRLLAVGGVSLGAFQGLEWGVAFPGAARGLILWHGAGRSDRRLHIVMDAMLNAITSDAGYQGGRYTQNPVEGLRRAGQIYMPWLLSDAFFASIRDEAFYERVRTTLGDQTARNWDANSYLWRYRAGREYDVSRPYGGDMARALSRVQARALVISSSSDRTVFPDLTAEIVRYLPRAEHYIVETDRGHAASGQPVNSPEWQVFNDRTRAFLEQLSFE